jgi:hypothetical protein
LPHCPKNTKENDFVVPSGSGEATFAGRLDQGALGDQKGNRQVSTDGLNPFPHS